MHSYRGSASTFVFDEDTEHTQAMVLTWVLHKYNYRMAVT